eukprot:TRINITY_DN55709_c0_g1_i1.p1 TRINITY_DN55709_c0_g1~~TRINITY_DN55709_c0_g1_i1.p1  ORF type:complete len:1190 (+),score=-12.95 TRINITY_DN55709_c0_g1_i1:74-3643(+)
MRNPVCSVVSRYVPFALWSSLASAECGANEASCTPGQYLPCPRDCKKYMQCQVTAGTGALQSCGGSLVWDVAITNCNTLASADTSYAEPGYPCPAPTLAPTLGPTLQSNCDIWPSCTHLNGECCPTPTYVWLTCCCSDPGAPLPCPPPVPTPAPSAPTTAPSKFPTGPSNAPSSQPTPAPTAPTASPTTTSPTPAPTTSPTLAPNASPTPPPTLSPTTQPTAQPTLSPGSGPTGSPTQLPTSQPTGSPVVFPSQSPASGPSASPTRSPSGRPTVSPSQAPVSTPTQAPAAAAVPSAPPTTTPSAPPSAQPTGPPVEPTESPSFSPTLRPVPPSSPTELPSPGPTFSPAFPTGQPAGPTAPPSMSPSLRPTAPNGSPSMLPTPSPSTLPTSSPAVLPTSMPSPATVRPSYSPTEVPLLPTAPPLYAPSGDPTLSPQLSPSLSPRDPTTAPTDAPLLFPTSTPTQPPLVGPSSPPTDPPLGPTRPPSIAPAAKPTPRPTSAPSLPPTDPAGIPSRLPSASPAASPTLTPSADPSQPPIFPRKAPSLPPRAMPSSPPEPPAAPTPSSSPSRAPTSILQAYDYATAAAEVLARKVTGSLQVGASVSALWNSAPGLAGLLLLNEEHCGHDAHHYGGYEQDRLTVMMHPLRFHISGDIYVGCVTGNMTITAIFFSVTALMHLIGRPLMRRGGGDPRKLEATLAVPSVFFTVLIFLYQGSTYSVGHLLLRDSMYAAAPRLVAGTVGLIGLVVLAPAVTWYVVLRRIHVEAIWEDDFAGRYKFFLGAGEWCSQKEGRWHERYAMCVWPYKPPHMRKAVLAQFLETCTLSLIAAIPKSSYVQCSWAHGGYTLVVLVHGAWCMYTMPFARPRDTVWEVLTSAIIVAAMTLRIVAYGSIERAGSSASGYFRAASLILLTAAIITVVKVVLDLICWAKVTSWSCGRWKHVGRREVLQDAVDRRHLFEPFVGEGYDCCSTAMPPSHPDVCNSASTSIAASVSECTDRHPLAGGPSPQRPRGQSPEAKRSLHASVPGRQSRNTDRLRRTVSVGVPNIRRSGTPQTDFTLRLRSQRRRTVAGRGEDWSKRSQADVPGSRGSLTPPPRMLDPAALSSPVGSPTYLGTPPVPPLSSQKTDACSFERTASAGRGMAATSGRTLREAPDSYVRRGLVSHSERRGATLPRRHPSHTLSRLADNADLVAL